MRKAVYAAGIGALGAGAVLVLQKIIPGRRGKKATPASGAWFGEPLSEGPDASRKPEAPAARPRAEKVERQTLIMADEPLVDESDVAGIVLGEKVSAFQVEISARMFLEGGMDRPLQRAWESVKQQVYEKHFAEDHGLVPSDKEVQLFTESMRDMVEASPEGQACSNILIKATGLGEERYWSEYRMKYETPAQMIKMRIDQYLADNFMGQLDCANIYGELTNQTLLDKFRD